MSRRAAEIAALEQHLLVAVLRGDDHARLRARGEIARLKKQAPPAPEQNAFRPRVRSSPLVACGDQR